MKKISSKFKYAIALLILVIAVLPLLLQSDYLVMVADMGAITGLVVLGLVVLVGFTGLLSLGQVAFYAIGAYTAAIFSTKLGFSPWLGLLAAGLIAGIWGLIIGLPAFNLQGPFLVIITIGFAEIVRILLLNMQDITGGPFGISQIPQLTIGGFIISSPIIFYYFIIITLALFVFAVNRLRASRIGRALVSIRDDEVAAEIMGVDVRRYKLISFTISAVLAGIAGAFYAYLTSYIVPDLFTFNESAQYLSITVLGGFNSIGSPLIGIFLTLLPELLRSLKDYYMLFFSFILIILIVIVAWRQYRAMEEK